MLSARSLRKAVIFALAGLVPAAAAIGNDRPLWGEAQSGSDFAKSPEIPLTIDVTAQLNFSRIALARGAKDGQAKINPESGAIELQKGLVDLGGYSVAGTAIIRGEPGRQVRVDMPASIRMTSAAGGNIELTALVTNLGAAPRIDATGMLIFAFGGALTINGDVSGKFRGRIPITVQYE